MQRRFDFVAAGICLGAAWGFVASVPALSYLLQLPGDNWQGIVCEWALRELGSNSLPPPGPTLILVLCYALLFGGLACAARPIVSRLPILHRWLNLHPIAIGALMGCVPLVLLPLLWLHRGIHHVAPGLVVVTFGFMLWTGLTSPIVAAYPGLMRRHRSVALGIPALALILFQGWSFADASLGRAPSPTTQPAPRRVVLIGIDAASWSNLAPGLAEGRLPNLQSLLDRGSRGDLQTTSPVLSPVIWTTIVTGVEAAKHNIRNFTLNSVPYTSNSRQAFALWEILPRYGLRSAFHYWWSSWPAEEVDGLLVTDRFLDYELDRRVSPESSLVELDDLGDAARSDAATVESLIGGFPGPSFVQRHRRKIDVLDEILERDEVATVLGIAALQGDYDLVATYLRAPDAVGHKFFKWHFHDRHPTLARWVYGERDADQVTLEPLVEFVNQVIDEQLGRLVEAAGNDVNFMIVSDHGMTATVPIGRSADEEPETGGHHRSGVVLLAGPDIREGVAIRGATVYDAFPTLLYLLDLPVPEGLPGRVLSEAIADELRGDRRLASIPQLGARDVGDPTPIPTGADEGYLEQLRALGYAID